MKNVWLVLMAVIVIPSFVFVPRINAEDFVQKRNLVQSKTKTPAVSKKEVSLNDGQPTKEELQKIVNDKSIETIKVPRGTFEPEATPKKMPKFSVAVGLGNGYKLGDREQGRYHYDSSLPLSIQFGYSPCKYVELQGEYLNTNFYRKRSWGEQNHRFNNYGLNLKFRTPLNIKGVAFSPYFVIGTGKSKGAYEGIDTGTKFKYSGSGKYTKIGGGAEVKIYKNMMLFSEFNYWKIGNITTHNVFDKLDSNEYLERNYFSSVSGGIGLQF